MFVKLVDPKVRAAFVATQNSSFFLLSLFLFLERVTFEALIWVQFLLSLQFYLTLHQTCLKSRLILETKCRNM